jgi:hypothetical protein
MVAQMIERDLVSELGIKLLPKRTYGLEATGGGRWAVMTRPRS